MRPIELGPNQPHQFYRGGGAIADLRGTTLVDEYRPEDWVGSATARFGAAEDGLTVLPDGRKLKDAVAASPEEWLGPEHSAYFGSGTALLVKFLDAGQRLPVHVHPDRTFAYRHLGTRHGKTEAWLIVGTKGADPSVYLGWSRDVEYSEMCQWVNEQDSQAMLSNMHKLTVREGTAVVVPAGTAHAIGEGIFCVELQEPTDYSIMLEVKGFSDDLSGGDLGLGRDLALSCVRERAFSPAELGALQRHNQALTRALPAAAEVGAGGDAELLPAAARPYFRAQRAGRSNPGPLEPSFGVFICTAGEGRLVGGDWEMPVRRGSTVVVPWAAGPIFVNGEAELIRCLPPLPSDAALDEPDGRARQAVQR